jgi:glycine cleavage system H protein
MNIPDGLLYSKEHEWVRVDGKFATIGITDHAQSALGDITFIDLPKPGTAFKQFKQFASVESVKAVSDVYAPLSGKVVKVNDELNAHPEAINKSPYEQGWFVIIEIENESEKNALLSPAAYGNFLKES